MPYHIVKIGEFGVAIPQEKMFDVATLKIDLRSTIRALERIKLGKRNPGRPRKVNPSNTGDEG